MTESEYFTKATEPDGRIILSPDRDDDLVEFGNSTAVNELLIITKICFLHLVEKIWGLSLVKLDQYANSAKMFMDIGRDNYLLGLNNVSLIRALSVIAVRAAMRTSQGTYRVGAVLYQPGSGDEEKIGVAFRGLSDRDTHAEAQLMQKARENGIETRNSWLFSNLEPCSHRTDLGLKSCAQMAIDHGVSRVVFTGLDPAEKVNGTGIDLLNRHHVEVLQIPALIPAALAVNSHYAHFQRTLMALSENPFPPHLILQIS